MQRYKIINPVFRFGLLGSLVLSLIACNGGGDGDSGGVQGVATLSWTPPTTRTDGSSLTNLAGYRIYYGTTEGEYSITVDLDNPGLTDYVIEGLSSGKTYYFTMTAYDELGIESAHSNVVSKQYFGLLIGDQ